MLRRDFLLILTLFSVGALLPLSGAASVSVPHAYEVRSVAEPVLRSEKSRILFKLLTEMPSTAKRDELSRRWKAIDVVAKSLGWDHWEDTVKESEWNMLTHFRQQSSTTVMGKEDSKNGSSRELGVRNWVAAERQVRHWASLGSHPTADRILLLNKMLGEGLDNNFHEPGVPRQYEFPDWFSAFSAHDLDESLSHFDRWYEEARTRLHPVELATLAYQRLITIHPTPDGNGRTSRLVLDWILLLNGLPPAAFPNSASSVIHRSVNPDRDVPVDASLERVTRAVEYSLQLLR